MVNDRPVLLTRYFIHLFFGLSFWPYVLLPVFLQELGADLLMVGIMMGMASFSGILVRPWVGISLDGGNDISKPVYINDLALNIFII